MTVATQERPWGVSRVTAFAPSASVRVPHVELDPETQTGRYLDPYGQPIEAGKHGTNRETSKGTRTGISPDGNAPAEPDSDSSQDYGDD